MKPANLWPQGGGKASYPPTMAEVIRLESYDPTTDSMGNIEPAWTTFADNVPAAYLPLNGVEFIAAEGEHHKVAVRFPIPYLPGVLPSMRVVHRGAVYAIRAVIPDPMNAYWLTLLCDTGATGG